MFTMNFCLLCLVANKNVEEGIQVNSEKWKQQNMKHLIDKHLWPMELVHASSWMCKICGEELNDFHKFYGRIKIAQETLLDRELKTETSVFDQKYLIDGDNSHNYHKNNISCKKTYMERHLEPPIIMGQPLPTEFVIDGPFIKIENVEDLIDENLTQQEQKKCRLKEEKRENTEIMEDPLKKASKKSKQSKVTNRNKKALLPDKAENLDENQNNFDFQNKLQSTMETKVNNESEIDPEQDKSKIGVVKKKNHRNLDDKVLKEYDRIIEEHFKIFCNICQIELDNFLSLRKHFKVEHKQRGYARCCRRNFFTRSLLVDHIHVHLNPEYFKCFQCGKVFSDRSRLQCHKKLHDDDSKLDKCDVCSKLFADKGALKKHVLTHSSEKLFPCSICGKYFTNSFILTHHIEAVHENKFVQICEICGKSIRCPTGFASHMEKHHIKSACISCDICGLLLSNKEGLKRHKKSQHPEGGKKEHTCHICLKVSPTQRALKSHIRSVHEQGFDYKCNLCQKSFKRPAVLREHMATHTGTALYTCSWCPRTFISNGNMYNHRKNAHPKEWEELKRQKYAENVSAINNVRTNN